MQRYKLLLEYDGSGFSGWQFQTNARSVQAELEMALSSLLQESIRVQGAGRTDAGVHASGMTAHFDSKTTLDLPVLLKGVNAILPADVAVHSVERVPDDFHARFSASSRQYRYAIYRQKKALGRAYGWVHFGALDSDAIREALTLISGSHDFSGVSKRTADPGHRYCYVFESSWDETDDGYTFTIKANRFLYGMVRCLVGGLVQIGRGGLTVDAFRAILDSRDHARAPMLVPPHGLTLSEVRYDADERAVVRAEMDALRQELPGDDSDE